MLKKHNSFWRFYGVSMIMITAVFIVLYFSFLNGQYLYAYSDIGSDTITSYLPRIIFQIRNILTHNNFYTLINGLGTAANLSLSTYLNPVNLPLLLFGESHLQWGLLLSLYLKYAAICLFALIFFRRVIHDDSIAICCTLLWTYSGYSVLWGQHYQFLTHILAFTISMVGLQFFLDEDRKQFLLIPALATLALDSYYFLYMSCFLYAGYSICYLAFHGASAQKIFKKACLFALSLFLSFGIAGFYMIPAVMRFLGGTRSSDVTKALADRSIFYSPQHILTFLSRLLNNNTLGAGSSYTGVVNYYESAVLSVSILFFFMLIFLLHGKYRAKTAVITIVCFLLLTMTTTSKLLGFTTRSQRWSYLFCFLETLMIGIGLRDYFEQQKQSNSHKIIYRTILFSNLAVAGFLVLLWICQERTAIRISRTTYVNILFFFILYSAYFLLSHRRTYQCQYVLLAGCVLLECIAANIATVNDRSRVPVSSWYEDLYQDQTAEIIEQLKIRDNNLYRINKTYDSVYYNDALVQNYPGLAVYSSTNNACLYHLYTSLGYESQYASNYIRFSGQDCISNTLLGMKYLITRKGEPVNQQFYRQIDENERFTVYENQLDLGFGYLYPDQLSLQCFENASFTGRRLLLTHAYYRTDGTEDSFLQDKDIISDDLDMQDLILYFTSAQNAGTSRDDDTLTLRVTGTGDDMQLFFDLPTIPDGWRINAVTVTLTAEQPSLIQLFIDSDGQGYSQENSATASYTEGMSTHRFDLFAYDNLSHLRLDPSTIAQNVVIESMELELVRENAIEENLQTLQKSCITDMVQSDNTFSGTVTNPYPDGAMLCIPLIYSSHWEAEVDGKTADVQNINGGLVGIRLGAGYHQISVTYTDHTSQTGWIISAISLILYIVGVVIWLFCTREKTSRSA